MRAKWIGAVAATLVVMSACGGNGRPAGGDGAPAEEPVDNVVRVVGGEYSYSMPAEIEGGVVSLELVNEGMEHHEFGFGRLEEGTDIEDVIKNLKKGEDIEGSEDLAGVPVLSPGVTTTTVRDLAPAPISSSAPFPIPTSRLIGRTAWSPASR